MADIKSWMIENCLKLNEDKTEVVILGTPQHRRTLNISSINICGNDINIAGAAKNIGMILDSSLKLEDQVNKTCRACYYHLKNIWRIRKSLTVETTKSLVHAMVISRLDFMNSLYCGINQSEIAKLQKVQNAAARLVLRAPKRAHTTDLLYTLHWLPVRKRIQYKLLTTTYRCIKGTAPDYLGELLKPYVNERPGLRSEENILLAMPRNRQSTFGLRAFQVLAPRLWNNLPMLIRNEKTLTLFKKT